MKLLDWLKDWYPNPSDMRPVDDDENTKSSCICNIKKITNEKSIKSKY